MPLKALWVVAKDTPGDLFVTGHRLDGPGTMRFARESAAPADSLVIPDARLGGVTPGGADAQTLAGYAFHSSTALVPTPGCWEYVAHLGAHEVRIVVWIYDCRGLGPPAGC